MCMALHKWAPGCARTASQEHHTVSYLIHECSGCEELNNKVFFFCLPAWHANIYTEPTTKKK